MDNPAADLVIIKKICKELQKELAFSSPDAKNVMRLSEEIKYLADCILMWAKKQ